MPKVQLEEHIGSVMIFDDPGTAGRTADTMDCSHHYGAGKETMELGVFNRI